MMVPSNQTNPPEDMKIGVVAKRLNISIRTIHMYEREGLFISKKNAAGTRYFSERDVEWLVEIRRMIKPSVGIAGIRYLLSLIPCWEINECIANGNSQCPVITNHDTPCWSKQDSFCKRDQQECRKCCVYDIRFSVGALKKCLHISLKPTEET